ncbi:MAG: hypothetical protein Q8Q52_08160, partial [Acidimicrobiia bacterium]|nr:hypothetical protein [Acidimicrobiia bacterium]
MTRGKRTLVVRSLAVTLGVASLSLLAGPVQAEEHRVLLIEIDGVITPVIADFVGDAVAVAEEGEFEALVV